MSTTWVWVHGEVYIRFIFLDSWISVRVRVLPRPNRVSKLPVMFILVYLSISDKFRYYKYIFKFWICVFDYSPVFRVKFQFFKNIFVFVFRYFSVLVLWNFSGTSILSSLKYLNQSGPPMYPIVIVI